MNVDIGIYWSRYFTCSAPQNTPIVRDDHTQTVGSLCACHYWASGSESEKKESLYVHIYINEKTINGLSRNQFLMQFFGRYNINIYQYYSNSIPVLTITEI